MEKICIVKRRKKLQELEKDITSSNEEISIQDLKVSETSSYKLARSIDPSERGIPIFEEVTGQNDQILSIELTPEQSEIVRSTESIQELLKGVSDGVNLDIQQGKDGKIFFVFYFKPIYMVRMLNTKSVCEMLQISRSHVAKLIREKHIKSYKIGRSRRFSLEDVLEFVNKSVEK
ncbi:MAG: helix-turn-helix domain-containing protein [Thermodesulfobacteriota bacterium]|nr:helix-turn-helix domain-containing protein [Thermodesulfobacteriota bacterium]